MIRELALPGVLLVEPVVHGDARGFFLETWHAEKYRAGGLDATFVQDNHSRSAAGTLRGLHAQLARPQGKLVRCVEGEIFDVAVDIRRGSPSFGRWVGERLSAANFRQLYVPPGYAHGFCVTAGPAQVEYKCTAFYDPADEIAIACPFCFVMLDDGVKELGREDVPVRDIAMILADGLAAPTGDI